MTTTMEQLALRLAVASPDDDATIILHQLITALDETTSTFDLGHLYVLNTADFELAMALIADWRFRRHLFVGCGGLKTALERIPGITGAAKLETVH